MPDGLVSRPNFLLACPPRLAYIAPHADACVRTSGGAIAQLGERLNGIQEVSGSIPLGSTKSHKIKALELRATGAPHEGVTRLNLAAFASQAAVRLSQCSEGLQRLHGT